jgi:sulfur carrier protein ThiS
VVDLAGSVPDDAGMRSSRTSGAAVTVDVRLAARLGAGRRTVSLAQGATVADLLDTLAPQLGLEPERLAGVAVAVQGEVVGRDRPLRDGEALALILPVAGG